VFRHVACNVESTPRVAIVRNCTVNEQSVLIFSIERDKIVDSFDNVVTMLRNALEENSGFVFRQVVEVSSSLLCTEPALGPIQHPIRRISGALFALVMRQWHEAKCRFPSSAES